MDLDNRRIRLRARYARGSGGPQWRPVELPHSNARPRSRGNGSAAPSVVGFGSMVPTDYHDFLLGVVSMGAALVGLLFVAISVNPGGIGEAGHLTMRLPAVCAMSALLNALFVSMVALLPGGTIGGVAAALGSSGVLTMVGLLLVLRRRREPGASAGERCSMRPEVGSVPAAGSESGSAPASERANRLCRPSRADRMRVSASYSCRPVLFRTANSMRRHPDRATAGVPGRR
ncbi:MAG TPA: hypothetical protein VGP05_25630 [Pseudonocardia sp.]|nr:hypothetical protein [Pseudonocardia sp.]